MEAGRGLALGADFAGYSLIARGVAGCFGYEAVNNFEQPYFSRSFTEFWRRWHISLSSWISEYLFAPVMSFVLGRVGRLRLATVEAEMRLAYPLVTLPVMLLVGLWHGAGFNYIVWGGLHGVFLSFERLVVFGKKSIGKRVRIRNAGDALRAGLAMLLARTIQCAVKRRTSPAGVSPARQLSLQPVAIGASGEATNSTEPLM